MLQSDSDWLTFGLAALNVLQAVALAWLAAKYRRANGRRK